MNKKVASFFQTTDPVLFSVYQQLDPTHQQIQVEPQPVANYFTNLCESIVSQQLSIKASDTIWQRFISLLPNKVPTPASIVKLSDDQMRGVGLSRAKTVYIKALAQAVDMKELVLDDLTSASNEDVIQKLTWVKGIGRWTAEMFIMFTLGRPDVFSLGDLGLRNAVQRWYGSNAKSLSIDEITAISNRWSPYRTYAARILWRSLELPTS